MIRLAVGLRRSPRPAAVLAGNVVDRFLDVAAQAGLVALGLALLPGSLPESLRSIATRMLLAAVAIGAVVDRYRIFSARRVASRTLYSDSAADSPVCAMHCEAFQHVPTC